MPIIERLDLRGIPECDNNDALRDENGEPVLSYRYLNLVFGASDYLQIKFHAMEIVNNRDAVVSRLQHRYNEMFPRVDNPNKVIAKDILSALDKR